MYYKGFTIIKNESSNATFYQIKKDDAWASPIFETTNLNYAVKIIDEIEIQERIQYWEEYEKEKATKG